MALMPFGFGTFSDPFMTDMERTMDRVFNRALGSFVPTGGMPGGGMLTSTGRTTQPGGALTTTGTFAIPMDIIERNDCFEVHADAPGMAPDDIKVELHEGVLTISGSRKAQKEEKDEQGKVWRSERTSYSFSRAFTLPENANPEGIDASMEQGVLKVTVPKMEVQAKPHPKRIQIKGHGGAKHKHVTGGGMEAGGMGAAGTEGGGMTGTDTAMAGTEAGGMAGAETRTAGGGTTAM